MSTINPINAVQPAPSQTSWSFEQAFYDLIDKVTNLFNAFIELLCGVEEKMPEIACEPTIRESRMQQQARDMATAILQNHQGPVEYICLSSTALFDFEFELIKEMLKKFPVNLTIADDANLPCLQAQTLRGLEQLQGKHQLRVDFNCSKERAQKAHVITAFDDCYGNDLIRQVRTQVSDPTCAFAYKYNGNYKFVRARQE